MASNASTTEASTNDAFITWFKSKGGSVHSAVGLTTFPSMGRGAIALHDIKKDTILFTLPRSLTLSTRTSSLPSNFGEQEWRRYQLHKGWVGLILCLLWEAASGEDGKWSDYLSSLPDSFRTPMFWDDKDLQELQGTTIFDKIGRAEAEKDYHDKLLPAIQSRPDLFPTQSLGPHYSLHMYHIMGSRILSRSFHVERWEEKSGDPADDEPSAHAAHSSDAMDVDATEPEPNEEGHDEVVQEEAESDDEGDEDPSDVAMVPLADVLNARYHAENAKLCYESEDLQMICTRDIQPGEQIWNTYGDPPNSDLLRRYGHVDWVPMPGGIDGNPADIVEIRADLVVDVLSTQTEQKGEDPFIERIEWWLEEGGDDLFTLETILTLPDGLVSLIRLLTMPKAEWEKTRDKGKVPKPKSDLNILRVAQTVLEKRLGTYKSSVQEDEALLSTSNRINSNKRMATVVRLGEKRILLGALEVTRRKMASEAKDGNKRRKESEDGDESRRSKKARR